MNSYGNLEKAIEESALKGDYLGLVSIARSKTFSFSEQLRKKAEKKISKTAEVLIDGFE